MTDPVHWHELPNAPSAGTTLGQRDALVSGEALLQTLSGGDGLERPFRYLLLRTGDDIKAFVNRCAHFGVPLAERQEHLHFVPNVSLTCNVHYAKYHWTDGACLSGECDGSPLLQIPVEVDAHGVIRISSHHGHQP